jgi:dihydropyrimidinase
VARREGAMTMIHAENADCIAWLTEQLLEAGLSAPRYHASRAADAGGARGHAPRHRAGRAGRRAGADRARVRARSRGADPRAQGLGLKVYAETCPQYLLLTAEDLGGDGFEGAKCICSPPPRDAANQAGDLARAGQRHLPGLSSDHAPVCLRGPGRASRWRAQGRRLTKVPNGIPGLETRLPLLMTHGVMAGRIDIHSFVALTSTNPGASVRLFPRKGTIAVGSDADIVIWDTDLDTVGAQRPAAPRGGLHTLRRPALEGLAARSHCRAVDVVWREGKYLGQAGHGQFLRMRPAGSPRRRAGRGHRSPVWTAYD